MKPTAAYATDGRASPRNIPCLYLAKEEDTAKAEIRPWLGSYVSVGRFDVIQNCELVDLSFKVSQCLTRLGRLTAEEVERKVWADIAFAFSKPVSPDDVLLDYIPTQILAEAFREKGYQGIQYRSLLRREGLNVALFDMRNARMTHSALYQLAEPVGYKYSPVFELFEIG
jgi:hypothetical protein